MILVKKFLCKEIIFSMKDFRSYICFLSYYEWHHLSYVWSQCRFPLILHINFLWCLLYLVFIGTLDSAVVYNNSIHFSHSYYFNKCQPNFSLRLIFLKLYNCLICFQINYLIIFIFNFYYFGMRVVLNHTRFI